MLASTIRRFAPADLNGTISWVLKRLVQKYPGKNEIGWANYLRSTSNRNDVLFIVQPHCIALAETFQLGTLDGKRMVHETFVWCEDRLNHTQVEAAANFYDEFHRWAVSLGVNEIEVGRDTDVPLEMIAAKLGRLWVTQIRRAKV